MFEEYELVPCRCGGKVEFTGGTYGYPTFGIRCLKCGGQWSMDTYSPLEAAKKWGIRGSYESQSNKKDSKKKR